MQHNNVFVKFWLDFTTHDIVHSRRKRCCCIVWGSTLSLLGILTMESSWTAPLLWKEPTTSSFYPESFQFVVKIARLGSLIECGVNSRELTSMPKVLQSDHPLKLKPVNMLLCA